MKKAKKERKYTLSGQMTAIFIGLLVFILMTVFIVNTGFLGRYYMSHKQKDLIEMYEAMEILERRLCKRNLWRNLKKQILMSARWIFLTMEKLYLQM